MAESDIARWKRYLNEQAAELGLEKNVTTANQRESSIEPIQWIYQPYGSEAIPLGSSIEEVEASLRMMVGA